MSDESEDDDGEEDSKSLMKEADKLMKQNKKLKSEVELNKEQIRLVSELENKVKSQKRMINQLQSEIKQKEDELKLTESILEETDDNTALKTIAQLKEEIGFLKTKQKDLKEKNLELLKQVNDMNNRNNKVAASLRQAKKQNEKLSSHLNSGEDENRKQSKNSSSVPPPSSISLSSSVSSRATSRSVSPSVSSVRGSGGKSPALMTKEQQVQELRRRLRTVVTTKDLEIKSLQKKLATVQERNSTLKGELEREQRNKGEKEQQMKVLLEQINKLEKKNISHNTSPIPSHDFSALISPSSGVVSQRKSNTSSPSPSHTVCSPPAVNSHFSSLHPLSSASSSSASSSSSPLSDPNVDDESILTKKETTATAKGSPLPPLRVSSSGSSSGGRVLRPLSGPQQAVAAAGAGAVGVSVDSHNSVLPPRFSSEKKVRSAAGYGGNTPAPVGGDDTAHDAKEKGAKKVGMAVRTADVAVEEDEEIVETGERVPFKKSKKKKT